MPGAPFGRRRPPQKQRTSGRTAGSRRPRNVRRLVARACPPGPRCQARRRALATQREGERREGRRDEEPKDETLEGAPRQRFGRLPKWPRCQLLRRPRITRREPASKVKAPVAELESISGAEGSRAHAALPPRSSISTRSLRIFRSSSYRFVSLIDVTRAHLWCQSHNPAKLASYLVWACRRLRRPSGGGAAHGAR